ncbi:MAG: hypothetical protein AB7O57_21635 [Hyphomicrobiaceae bacterium]
MSTRAWITVVLSMLIGVVLAGASVALVLSVPLLEAHAAALLPALALAGFITAPLVAWQIAPLLRIRVQKSNSTKRRLLEKHGEKLAARR